MRQEVDEVCEKSKESLQDVQAIVDLDVFNDDDKKTVGDRKNDLKEKISLLDETSDTKFDK